MNSVHLSVAVVALAAVLAGAWLSLRALQRLIGSRVRGSEGGNNQLALRASLMLDQRRRVVVVGYAGRETLLLIAPDGNLCCGWVDRATTIRPTCGAVDRAG